MLAVILFLVFVSLKVSHVIDWSWWWVCSPLWIGLTIDLINAQTKGR